MGLLKRLDPEKLQKIGLPLLLEAELERILRSSYDYDDVSPSERRAALKKQSSDPRLSNNAKKRLKKSESSGDGELDALSEEEALVCLLSVPSKFNCSHGSLGK